MNSISEELNEIAKDAFQASINFARHNWTNTAQKELKSSREQYKAGIQTPVKTSETSGYIELTGAFPVMLEKGFGPFDIKQGFANSPKRTVVDYDPLTGRSAGWYLTIPIRHHTPGSGTNPMPRNVHQEASKLDHKEQLRETLVRALGYEPQISHTGYRWQNAMYDHMQRSIKHYDNGAKRSHYTTFRRVSDKSNPRSWIHPGHSAVDIASRVAKNTEDFFYDYVDGMLD